MRVQLESETNEEGEGSDGTMMDTFKLGCGFALGQASLPLAFIAMVAVFAGAFYAYFYLADAVASIRRRWRKRR